MRVYRDRTEPKGPPHVCLVGSVEFTGDSSARSMAACFRRDRSSLSKTWISSADRLEKVGLTATETRPEPELTEVFLTILFLLDRVIRSL